MRGGQLTLSERRRLEVARALAMEPKIVLLDEVMAGLNPTEIRHMVELVQTLNARGLTFLVIEHNLKVVRQFSAPGAGAAPRRHAGGGHGGRGAVATRRWWKPMSGKSRQ